MAKVHHRRANKDYPQAGIAKGEMYYFAQIKTGPRSSKTIRQKDPIKPGQLTSSDYLSRLYDLQEQLADITDPHDAADIIDALRELGQEQREKFDNMPEGLQQGDTGQMLEERADTCEGAADEIETLMEGWDEEAVRAEIVEEAKAESELGEDQIELTEEEIEANIQERREELLDEMRGLL
jgi:hypothetical protein